MSRFNHDGDGSGCHKVVLEVKPEGVYVFVFETSESQYPERDYLDDCLNDAKARCLEEYGIPVEAWRESSEG